MRDRASRYASTRSEKKMGDAILIAYVVRTPKGKIRLKRIGIRLHEKEEEQVCELPPTDPRYVFENDYKVRKSTHEEVRRSRQFARFWDSSARVIYVEN